MREEIDELMDFTCLFTNQMMLNLLMFELMMIKCEIKIERISDIPLDLQYKFQDTTGKVFILYSNINTGKDNEGYMKLFSSLSCDDIKDIPGKTLFFKPTMQYGDICVNETFIWLRQTLVELNNGVN